ncbi:hypothetical protein ACSSS7_000876 [Eimeria intestinalis]
MSMEQLMALVPLEAAMSHKEKGRRSRKLNAGILEFFDADIRPPSPPPVYDRNGGRVNTRDVRVRTAMQNEMQRLCEFMVNNLEGFTPPPDYRPTKKVRRIEFPHEKGGGIMVDLCVIARFFQYPDYNFMGIIIGPRGCNHKRLEAESGCTISVRGRGTQKEGKRDHQTDEEACMPMHVHIMGDTDEAVEVSSHHPRLDLSPASGLQQHSYQMGLHSSERITLFFFLCFVLQRAVALVEPLLDPLHPAHEEFKRRGLEQLALVNGVNYSDLDQRRCAICQALGHLGVSPNKPVNSRSLQGYKLITGLNGNLKFCIKSKYACLSLQRCAICGDLGHVTMDCKMRRPDAIGAGGIRPPPPPPGAGRPLSYRSGVDHHKMDMEYRRMMDELSGDKSGLGALDVPRPPPGPAGPGRSPVGASPASQGYTPPPGVSPAGPNGVGSPYPGRAPPPPVVLGQHRMGPGMPPPHMMPMNRMGVPGSWGGPWAPGGPPPPGGDMHWGNSMRPPMGMMPMGGVPPGMWGGPMGPPMGYGAPTGGGKWPMPPPDGCPPASGVSPVGPPQSGSSTPMPPAMPPPSAPSMPPPPMPGGSADPDSMECGD